MQLNQVWNATRTVAQGRISRRTGTLPSVQWHRACATSQLVDGLLVQRHLPRVHGRCRMPAADVLDSSWFCHFPAGFCFPGDECAFAET